MAVLDDVHGNFFAGIDRNVASFGYFTKLFSRELETVAVGKVIRVAVVFQPAVLDCISSGIGHRSVTHEPAALLVVVHFIAEEPDVNFVAVTFAHATMISF